MKIIIFVLASFVACISVQAKTRLDRGGFLYTNETLESANKAYKAWLKPDGNFVIMNAAGDTTWETKTADKGNPPFKLAMQLDNNLVLWDKDFKKLWASGTNVQEYGAAYVVMDNSGKLVLYDGWKRPQWNKTIDYSRF